MNGSKSLTVWFNVLYLLGGVAVIFGFGDFQPSQNVIELGAIIGAIVNLVLRLRPLPPDQESFR